jgi:hypothetical protein
MSRQLRLIGYCWDFSGGITLREPARIGFSV